jgi:hypothetical protein
MLEILLTLHCIDLRSLILAHAGLLSRSRPSPRQPPLLASLAYALACPAVPPSSQPLLSLAPTSLTCSLRARTRTHGGAMEEGHVGALYRRRGPCSR